MQTRAARSDREPVDQRWLVAGLLRTAPDVAIAGEVPGKRSVAPAAHLSCSVTVHRGLQRLDPINRQGGPAGRGCRPRPRGQTPEALVLIQVPEGCSSTPLKPHLLDWLAENILQDGLSRQGRRSLLTFGVGCCRFEPCPPSEQGPASAWFRGSVFKD
jgi:hypothetical protein